MSDIAVRLLRGPDDQPVGSVRLASGQVAEFTGWLALIRILEDELDALPSQPDAPGGGDLDPSSER